ncbi:MAG: TetR family transcriptional regulator [Dermatophilaceae bacterium]
MAWDTARTRRLLLEAAVLEFSEHGPHGARVARVAERATVNKERIYQYFGNKEGLFLAVLASELGKAVDAVPLTVEHATDLGEYAGRIFDYQRANPALVRLLAWESLGYGTDVASESARADYYADKISTVARAQKDGIVADDLDADQLVYAILALSSFWSTMPQIARLLVAADDPDRQRRTLVELVRSLTRAAC